jgi:hypothetical protein
MSPSGNSAFAVAERLFTKAAAVIEHLLDDPATPPLERRRLAVAVMSAFRPRPAARTTHPPAIQPAPTPKPEPDHEPGVPHKPEPKPARDPEPPLQPQPSDPAIVAGPAFPVHAPPSSPPSHALAAPASPALTSPPPVLTLPTPPLGSAPSPAALRDVAAFISTLPGLVEEPTFPESRKAKRRLERAQRREARRRARSP